MDSMQRIISERSWRVPGGERCPSGGKRHIARGRLEALFEEFSDQYTTSCAARGLVQGIVLTIGNDCWMNSEEGRTLREMIVAFLTDIGTKDPNFRYENDPEVRLTARRTLARHVSPIIASQLKGHDSRAQVAALQSENFWTLSHLVSFYTERKHISELDGKHLRNVKECLGRVYRELRRQLDLGPFPDDKTRKMVNDEAHVRLQMLTELFVEHRWWDVISLVRAMNAIPALYDVVTRHRSSAEGLRVPLRFDWNHIERFKCDRSLEDYRFIDANFETVRQDVWDIQVAAGGWFDPKKHNKRTLWDGDDHKGDLDGVRPLLLDLVATFVREVELIRAR